MIALLVYPTLALAVIWGGYPLAVRLIASLPRRNRPVPPSRRPSVSVVVASADDAAAIRARVADLLRTNYPAELVRVVVALDASRARATIGELADLGDRVTIVPGDAPGGKAASLNAGVRAATSEILVFADTAQRFDPGAIGALVAALDDPRLGAVSGMLDLPGAGGTLNVAERYWRYERALRRWEAEIHSCVGVTGAIYAMRRGLWTPLPPGLILDDVYVPMKLALAGWRIGFTHQATAVDPRRFTPAQEYRRKVRTLTGNIQVCAWLPAILNPVRNPLWLQFVFHKLLRLLTPYLATLAALGGMAVVASQALQRPFGVRFLICMGVATGLMAVIPRVRRSLAWAMALQGSVVVATVNGIRGRWDVWQ